MSNLIVMSTYFPWGIVFALGAFLICFFIFLTPWNISKLKSHPRPAKNYTEALLRIESLRSREPQTMTPVCRLQFMTHGDKVERAVILVHGYTNCPQQFHELGQRFFDLGWNVLIAPIPHHGLADRMTEDHALLKAEEMAAYADETVDIAQGLAEKVVMMGISAGGVTSAWAAQVRSDLDTAVIISPAFGFKEIPTLLTAALMNVFVFLPDEFTWWNLEKKDALLPPVYAYPRYSRHALVQTLRLGFATIAAARRTRPAARKLCVVLNENDKSVNNDLTKNVIEIWQSHHANLGLFEFEASLKLGHDLIDPTQPDQQIELVYPHLIELANQ